MRRRESALDTEGSEESDQDDLPCEECPIVGNDNDMNRFICGVDDPFTEDAMASNVVDLPTGEDLIIDQSLDAEHSRVDTVPIYDGKRLFPSHYLLNNGFGILKRGVARYATNKTSLIFNNIVRSGKSPIVSLLWTEGNLFPNIFYKNHNDSIPGALPYHMYEGGSKGHLPGMGSLMSHNRVRVFDGDLATSHSFHYLHWLFDIHVNEKLNHNSSELVFRRGFEHLAEKGGIGVMPMNTALEYDDFDSSRKIKELASMMKKAPWDVFYTVTGNDTGAPGLAPVVHAMKFACQPGEWFGEQPNISSKDFPWYYPFQIDNEKYRVMYDYNLVLLTRIWQRTLHYLNMFIEESPSEIMGRVYGHFSRIEFQSAGSPGAIALEDAVKNLLEILEKRIAELEAIHNPRHTGDPKLTQWIDALNQRYKIRHHAVQDVIRFLDQPRFHNNVHRDYLKEIMLQIEEGDGVLKDRYLQHTSENLCVSVLSSITPQQRLKFLFHTALTLGSYDCELQLFPHGDMEQAFIRAKLLQNPPTEDDLNIIKKRLIEEQYSYLPISAKRLSLYIKLTDEAVTEYFLGNRSLSFNVPCISEVALRQEAEDEVRQSLWDSESSIRTTLLRTLHQKNCDLPGIPSIEDFEGATMEEPLEWIPQLGRAHGQSQDSVEEQCNALNAGIQSIMRYIPYN
ncbi:unnamed protein product [Cyprideis torosa]|uniref:Uncharacterized protein n=1 Tax=Cyprideis torosa TaxID=163714 RepID=A0A7R8WDS0_9CRUS|nr:unnamed protein product [Cyprideis torosa]CAG0893519.1 unnamed protein product [Cyprideis torosa]